MGTEPVHGLLVRMSLPLMASMLIQSLYNIVDSIFVSRINEDALTAVSLCFPIQQLMIAFGIGTALGMSALLSRYLGAKRPDKLLRVAQNGIFLAFCTAVLIFIISFFAERFIAMQISDPRIIEYGSTYLRIVCQRSIFVFAQITVERLLQSTGKTLYIFFIQGSGAIINIIMDPILIFGLFGAPKLGVAGAAIATVFGQTFGALLGLYLNFTRNKEVPITFRGFRPDLGVIREIYKIGLPSIVMQSIGSVMIFGLNQILASFTKTAVATFGAYFKLQSFIFMPLFGLSNGLVPIIAYNYGAHRPDRMREAMSFSARCGVGIMACGTILFWLLPALLLSFFDASPEMLEIGVPALRAISIGFPVAGYAIMRGSVFQALGRSIYSMNISVIRQLVVILPAAYLLSQLGNVRYVWLAFPIAEIVGLVMSILYTRKIHREVIDQL
ncbi:MAG: MATE family efflux transporter [Mogibacterium sp.]|nr:MATE family efflux transporter [Mogibacterium sp.]